MPWTGYIKFVTQTKETSETLYAYSIYINEQKTYSNFQKLCKLSTLQKTDKCTKGYLFPYSTQACGRIYMWHMIGNHIYYKVCSNDVCVRIKWKYKTWLENQRLPQT